MELSKDNFKRLLDNINWEIDDKSMWINKKTLKIILDKSLISYKDA